MEGLGIDALQLGAQIVNFTIVVFVLKHFLYTPILTMLDTRRAEIKEGLSLKDAMDEKAAAMKENQKKMKKTMREEERRVMKQAVAEAQERQKELLEEAKKEIQQEREKMLADVARERSQAHADAKDYALNLAVLISEKVLGKKLDAAAQKKLLEEAVNSI